MCDEAGGCRGFTGNFRRVCPTLNRARAFWNLIFDALDIAPRAASIRFEHKCRRNFSGFYLERVETPGRVFRQAETRTAKAENVAAYLKILNRRQKNSGNKRKNPNQTQKLRSHSDRCRSEEDRRNRKEKRLRSFRTHSAPHGEGNRHDPARSPQV